MKFNEAVQAMLDGEKVTRANGIGHGYIMIDDKGNVVDDDGDLYRLYKKDFIADWEIANIPSAGTLLTRYGKDYRLIKEADGTYTVLDEETYIEKAKGITEENLVHDLWCYDFDIVKTHKIN